ncbi:MAG: TetR/AcrR family transcriptional regulator [Caulobacterales bacterium]
MPRVRPSPDASNGVVGRLSDAVAPNAAIGDVRRAPASVRTRNRRGQKLGAKGDRTRMALMEAALELLSSRPIWEIKISDIAGMANVRGPNFYAYFDSVDDLLLALSEQATEDLPDMASLIDSGWEVLGGEACALRLAELSIDYWEKHRPVLRIVNMLADDGETRFLRARIARLAPTYRAFRRRIEAAKAAGRLAVGVDPRLAAYSLAVYLEQWGHHYHLTRREYERDQIVSTLGALLFSWLSGLDLFPSSKDDGP